MKLPYIFLLFFIGVFQAVVAQDCSASNPCKIGCCNSFGFCGFGPDYCGDKCVGNCDRKSDCNPGYGAQWAKKDKCPLNVCCSKSGFCGTTHDFCGDEKVPHKTCSKTSGTPRVVGYFEGWAKNRPCNVFWPEQIPSGLYSHINFAFATIDPKTFKVAPSLRSDPKLYERLMLLKKKDPHLKIYIAIGGWAFNDPGPTQTTFSDLAASLPRQKAFIGSLLSFMSTYGFDGVDLDWEYPEAPDRAGRGVDYTNFPIFMKRMKETLAFVDKGLTITLPASYWYLQHFDIIKLEKYIDWFNIMSYDLHGTWDKGNKWTGNFLNSHTNLTEIDLALDLLWRNNIDPFKVVMGLGFYGRSFTATSKSCLEPGCTFESGGEKGRCSGSIGTLLNSEIDEIVQKRGLTPKLYKDAAVKVVSWDDQWVTYDDEETFQLKAEYAQSRCLGGVMVWAISHDTEDSKYNMALSKAVNRKLAALPVKGSDSPYDFIDIPNPQCKWMNCGEPCPPSWILMTRNDPWRHNDKEYMFDPSGCGGDGQHPFCCPPGDRPKCGWYSHHNGKCDNTCPDGTVEVGATDANCHKNYQAACCTTNTKSMSAYKTIQWGEYPLCDNQTGCGGMGSKSTLLGQSTTGSGGATCNVRSYHFGERIIMQERKLCGDTSSDKYKLKDCQWYNNIGQKPGGGSDKWCRTGCPSDRVRVAIDQYTEECWNRGGGAQAQCCVPSFLDTIEVENPEIERYRSVLKAWVKNPTCSGSKDSKAGKVRRAANMTTTHIDGHSLATQKEQQLGPDGTAHEMSALLLLFLLQSGSSDTREILTGAWNDNVVERFANMRMPGFADFLRKQHEYKVEGPEDLSDEVICNAEFWDKKAGGSKSLLQCEVGYCTRNSCPDEPAALVRRSSLALKATNESYSELDHAYLADPHLHSWDRRKERKYVAELEDANGDTEEITLFLHLYYWQRLHDEPINDAVVDYVNRGNCDNSAVEPFVLVTGERYHFEHLLDGVAMRMFWRVKLEGAVAQSGAIPISFFRTSRSMSLPDPPPLRGRAEYSRLWERVMECLGSYYNRGQFILVHEDINGAKGAMAQGNNVVSDENVASGATNDARPQDLLHDIRTAFSVLRYLDSEEGLNPNQNLATIVNDIGDQLEYAQDQYNSNNPNARVDILGFWREWIRDYHAWLILRTDNWARRTIRTMRQHWGPSTSPISAQVLAFLADLEAQIGTFQINTNRFD